MAQTISLYPLGVGDSGTQAHWHTSFLLQIDERRLMVDCPRSLQQNKLYRLK